MEDFTLIEPTGQPVETALRLQRNWTLRQVAHLLGQGREGKLVAMVSSAQRYGDPPLASLSAHFTELVDLDERVPDEPADEPAAEAPAPAPPSAQSAQTGQIYATMTRNELIKLCHSRGLEAGPTTKAIEAVHMLEEQDAEGTKALAEAAAEDAARESIRA